MARWSTRSSWIALCPVPTWRPNGRSIPRPRSCAPGARSPLPRPYLEGPEARRPRTRFLGGRSGQRHRPGWITSSNSAPMCSTSTPSTWPGPITSTTPSTFSRSAPSTASRADFKRLAADAHQRGMKVVLDGVFNHMGRNAPIFKQALADPKPAPGAAGSTSARNTKAARCVVDGLSEPARAQSGEPRGAPTPLAGQGFGRPLLPA